MPRLRLSYRDKTGKESRRTVRVVRWDASMLHCMCEERQAVRSFRFDRVVEATDMSTGEIVPGIDLLRQLKEFD